MTEAFERLAAREHAPLHLTVLEGDGTAHRIPIDALWARARSIASSLHAHGIEAGDVVAIVLPTGRELPAAYLGAIIAGAVPTLIATPSHRLASADVYLRRVRTILENAQAAALIAEPDVTALVSSGDPVVGDAIVLTPDDLTAAAPERSAALVARPEDLASIQYSSGSTGTPNGVRLSHRAVLTNLRALRDALALSPADTSVNWIPLYHDMGLMGGFLLPLLCECPTVLIPTLDFLRRPSLWLRAIHDHRGTIAWAPNFAYALCTKRIADAELAGVDLSSWRLALNGSEPVLASTVEAFLARFEPYGFAPDAMTPVWGLAENVLVGTAAVGPGVRIDRISRQRLAAAATAQPAPTDPDALAVVGVGRCLPGCRVEIRDEAGAALPDRRAGTIWLRSASLFAGYHRDPEHTARVLVRGWLDTGDRGYVSDGELFFLARDKDLIVFAGDKYAPQDVEAVINAIDGVREGCVAAFGVLNEDRGTEDVAVVVETRETDPQTRERLEATIRAEVHRVTGLGVRHIVLVPPGGVEKTSSGKLARLATRRRYADRLRG